MPDTNMNDVYYAAGDYTQDLVMQMETISSRSAPCSVTAASPVRPKK
jgi:hypothetical protein